MSQPTAFARAEEVAEPGFDGYRSVAVDRA